MESPQPLPIRSAERTLRRSDFAFLLLLCALLYGYALVQPRVLTTHETVHCLNVREMFDSGEFFIPTYGGRPWLERPPLPHWLTGIFASLTGDMNRGWSMRLGSIFMATLATLVYAWAVAGRLGRTIGVMSGAILATTREFSTYATGPEADIFLASTVTIIGALLLRIQTEAPSETSGRSPTFFGKRSWLLALVFLSIGLTNWMKGPIFGMIFVFLPLVGYLAWNRNLREIRTYAWFWGWLIMGVAGTVWPFIAYQRYPDIVDLWMVDYGVRWKSGYIGEPAWYYLIQQPWNLFPWTLAVIAGLATTTGRVFRGESAPLRYLWCWAVLPILFFSLFEGKHHHYMLSCLAPAAVFGAIGATALWRWILSWPALLRRPWLPALLLGLPGTAIVLIVEALDKKIPGPDWLRYVVALGWPVLLAAYWSAACQRRGRTAFAGCCAVIVVVNGLMYSHRSFFLNSYEADQVFVEEAKALAEAEVPLLVANDVHALTSSWLMFYLGERPHLLHNLTFLRDDRLTAPEVYLICREQDEKALAEYGVAERLLQSSKTRGEESPKDRWTLYRLRFHANLARMPGDVPISPNQATGRSSGPFLGRSLASGDGMAK